MGKYGEGCEVSTNSSSPSHTSYLHQVSLQDIVDFLDIIGFPVLPVDHETATKLLKRPTFSPS